MLSIGLATSIVLQLTLLAAGRAEAGPNAAELGHAGSLVSGTRFPLAAKDVAAASPPIDLGLDRRQNAGDSCGPTAGNASCGADLCCSAAGLCGTGRDFCDAPACQFEYGPACDANAVPSGENTTSVPRPKFGSVLWGGGGVTQCSEPGTIAITYDDGPYIYTSELLDILNDNGVPATFFITSVNLDKGGIDNESTDWPDILLRMRDDGHQIASHTWSHQNLNDITSAQRFDQMVKNEMAFRNVLGYFPTYMRPPYNTCLRTAGCVDDLETLGYHIIKFNVDTLDYANLTPDTIQNSKDIFSNALAGGDPATSSFIVGNHDIHPQTVTNLTQFIIDEGKAQGYTFKTVGDCLGDPKGNWYRDPATGNAISAAAAAAKRADSASSKNLVVARAAGAASAAAESTAAAAASASASATAESGSSGLIALGKRLGLTVSLVNVAFALL
ncbi:Chitin-binding type 1 protein [Lasiodiplodia theobromae]|uniref:Chitin-binding type 1 protein n=1 Tax=Lasiodiplodia theobromae TaxID=45133 RepID=UPI0015C31CDA|nr:Chitin-binding type 1 protein [Lasiodiplodia theobromae]KAF4534774.1 Chitin-binding type 1 protein [Lasiodiplodia theobromae]